MSDHRVGLDSLLPGRAANIDDRGGFEGPDQRLNPWNNGEEADPAHQVDGVGFGMLARDGDASRQPENQNGGGKPRHDDREHGQEGGVIPEAELKSKQFFH